MMRNQPDNHLFDMIVFSLDFDDCISPSDDNGVQKERYNEMFTRMCTEIEANPIAKVILMLGSARQTILSDITHSLHNQNDSAIVYLHGLLEKFKHEHPQYASRITLDDFLLEDILLKKESGTHFKKRLNLTLNEIETYLSYLRRFHFSYAHVVKWQDETKHTLLYAQMQHIAKQYENLRILFFFADNLLKIIRSLQDVFQHKKRWIPKQMELQLLHYDCGQFTKNIFSRIIGAGFVDFDFRHNVRCVDPRLENDSATVGSYGQRSFPETLRYFIDKRQLTVLATFIEQCNDKDKECAILQYESGWGVNETACFIENYLSSCMQTNLYNRAFRFKNLKLIACILPILLIDVLSARLMDAIDCKDVALIDMMVSYLDQSHTTLPQQYLQAIVLQALRSKNYVLASNIAGEDFWYSNLSRLCHAFNQDGFLKSHFKQMVSHIFLHDRVSLLSCDLRHFCYQQAALATNQFNQDALITLHFILNMVARDTFQNKLIAAIVFSQQEMQTVIFPAKNKQQEIHNKVMLAGLPMHPTPEQEQIFNMIEIQSQTIHSSEDDINPMKAAYCALRLVMLSIDLSSQNAVKSAINYWKTVISTAWDNKTHEDLLRDEDNVVQIVQRIKSRFFAPNVNAISHIQFINSLPDKIAEQFVKAPVQRVA